MSQSIILFNGTLDIFTSLIVISRPNNHHWISMMNRSLLISPEFERYYSYYKILNGIIRIQYYLSINNHFAIIDLQKSIVKATYFTEILFLLNEHIFYETFDKMKCSLAIYVGVYIVLSLWMERNVEALSLPFGHIFSQFYGK